VELDEPNLTVFDDRFEVVAAERHHPVHLRRLCCHYWTVRTGRLIDLG